MTHHSHTHHRATPLKTFIAVGIFVALLLAPTSAFAQAVSAPDAAHPWCASTYTLNAAGDREASGMACYATEPACNALANKWAPCKQMDVRTGAQKVWDAVADKVSESAGAAFDFTLGRVIKWVAYLFFLIAGVFLNISGSLLDHAIEKTITSGILNDLYMVDVGWTLVRDACNMVFIFVLLYIAIRTILNISGGADKRLIASVIISALLINFSLFFTKVVIDSGNVVAKTFWDRMKIKQGSVTEPGFTAWALTGGQLQTVLDPEDKFNKDSTKSFTQIQLAMAYLGGALVMFVMGYVFLAGAIMMVLRIIGLIFAMIFSPFAILGIALPKWNYFPSWLGDLIKHTFSAPVLVFLLYLITTFIGSTDLGSISGGSGRSMAGAFSGKMPNNFTVIYHYIILVAMTTGALGITAKLAGSAGSTASSWAKRGIGAALGATAYGGRQTLGAYGRRVQGSKRLQDLSKEDSFRGRMAMRALSAGSTMQRSSFDLRNSRAFQATAGKALGSAMGKSGGEGGFEKTGSTVSKVTTAVPFMKTRGYVGESREKEILEEAERKFKNPEARARYIKERLGTEGQGPIPFTGKVTDRFDAVKYKQERIKLAQEKATNDAVKTLNGMGDTLKSVPVGGSLSPADEQKLRAALATVGKEGIAKVDDAILKHAEVIKRLSGEALSGINDAALIDKGKKEVAENIRQHIIDGKGVSASGKELVRKLEPNSSMYINFAKHIEDAVNANDDDKARRFVDLAGPKNIPEVGEDLIKKLGERGHLTKAHINAIEKRVADGIYGDNFPQDLVDRVIAGRAANPGNPYLERLHRTLETISNNRNKADSPFYDTFPRTAGGRPAGGSGGGGPTGGGTTGGGTASPPPAPPPPGGTPPPRPSGGTPPPPGYRYGPGGILVPTP